MDNPMDKKVSRRSVLGAGLKAAAALGAGPGLFSFLEQTSHGSKQAVVFRERTPRAPGS